MHIYNYHPKSGEFITASLADQDPLVAGKFLIPANATTIKPHDVSENQIACFIDGEWQSLVDYRGTVYWLKDGSKHIVSGIGVDIPKDASLEKVEPPKSTRRIGEFREFMALFTPEEQLNIVAASQQNPKIKLWYDTAMGGARFSLDHPQTEYGLSVLVSAELLAKSRKSEILGSDFNA